MDKQTNKNVLIVTLHFMHLCEECVNEDDYDVLIA
jgi:hypothetical protein